MTIKEFSDKYEVPYHIAYEASYMVKPYGTIRREREYSEEDLYTEINKLLDRRIQRHNQQIGICTRAKMTMSIHRKGAMA